ncbi:MAG: glycosyltransferase family 2 protein [Bacillota bacterium]
MNPKVSVVIPFYNRVDWLEEAVKSVLNQTYDVYEIIVVNDGSRENMDGFLSRYGSKVRYIVKENGGPAKARNIGIELSKGDYIAFLDSDDIWLPQKLEIQIPLMVQRGAIWSHTSYETFVDGDVNGQTKLKKTSMFNGDIYPEMLPSCNIATPCIVVKGDVIRNDTMLRFNPEMRYGQDSYLWLNLAIRYNILAIDESLTKVRVRGTNAALRARVQLRARAILWKYMRDNKEVYFQKKVPIFVKLAFNLSVFGTAILKMCEKIVKSDFYLENISRALYILPWLIFKANAKKVRGF